MIALNPNVTNIDDVRRALQAIKVHFDRLTAYGSLYRASGTTQTIGGTFQKVLGYDTNGPAQGTTPDQANGRITVEHSGRYLVLVDMGLLTAGTAGGVTIEGRKNGVAIPGCVTRFYVNTEERAGSVSAIVDCEAGDYIEVYATGSGATFTFICCNLTVQRVG